MTPRAQVDVARSLLLAFIQLGPAPAGGALVRERRPWGDEHVEEVSLASTPVEPDACPLLDESHRVEDGLPGGGV